MVAIKKLLVFTVFTLMINVVSSSNFLSSIKSFAAGGVGGCVSVMIGHPFDLVKVRMQTSKNATDNISTFGAFREIVKTDGFSGLYRGVSAPILAVAPIFATSFWGYDMGDRIVRMMCNNKAPDLPLTLLQLCVAGGISALPTTVIMVPSERIKCILQTQQADKKGKKDADTREYTGFMDCAKDLYKQGGLYKGTALTLMRDVPGNMVYFGVYEIVKGKLAGNPLAPMFAGAAAGVLFWPFILPTDTLKSRYQTAPEGTYKNIAHVYNDLVKTEGVGGLFRGIGPAMMRSAPANAFSFMGAEVTKKVLNMF